MNNLTRRSFLHQTPVAAAALGVLPAAPVVAATHRSPGVAIPRSSARATGSMIIHVNDIVSGEMTLLVGGREVVLRDRRLVARFVQAARSAKRA